MVYRNIFAFGLSCGLLVATGAFAGNTDPTLKQGDIVVPNPPASSLITDDPEDDDTEVSTDTDFFLSKGFKLPDYNVYYNLRSNAAKEVAEPDYAKRTGKIPPENVMIEVAPLYVTGGDFNDMLIFSHMPGDCAEEGCLAQVYRTEDGLTWEKVAERKTLAVVFRRPTKDTQGTVVFVGNSDHPSAMETWNGHSFESK